jgi:hypothetical protein
MDVEASCGLHTDPFVALSFFLYVLLLSPGGAGLFRSG